MLVTTPFFFLTSSLFKAFPDIFYIIFYITFLFYVVHPVHFSYCTIPWYKYNVIKHIRIFSSRHKNRFRTERNNCISTRPEFRGADYDWISYYFFFIYFFFSVFTVTAFNPLNTNSIVKKKKKKKSVLRKKNHPENIKRLCIERELYYIPSSNASYSLDKLRIFFLF